MSTPTVLKQAICNEVYERWPLEKSMYKKYPANRVFGHRDRTLHAGRAARPKISQPRIAGAIAM